jgi:hypothetical protein
MKVSTSFLRLSFILSYNEGIDEFPLHELAEALAIRKALVVVLKDHGYLNMILVSGCLSIIQRISSPVRNRSMYGIVVSDIKSLSEGFNSCSFKHNSRNLNVIAHRLARWSERSICNFFVDVIPDCIRAELCTNVI